MLLSLIVYNKAAHITSLVPIVLCYYTIVQSNAVGNFGDYCCFYFNVVYKFQYLLTVDKIFVYKACAIICKV